jgi:hypothetical protein
MTLAKINGHREAGETRGGEQQALPDVAHDRSADCRRRIPDRGRGARRA